MTIGDPALRAYSDIPAAWSRLAAYLGDDFDPALTDYATCCLHVTNEWTRLGDRFYTESTSYLYDLTHFHFTPHKDPFFRVVTDFASAHGLRDLADVGCGIGLDAQALLAAGYEVDLYDIESPSPRYANWRIRRDHGREVPVQPLDALGTATHDLVYAVDVIEHIPHPLPTVETLFRCAPYVCVNLFEHDRSAHDPTDMHYPLDHWTLLPAISDMGTLVQLASSSETVVTLWRSKLSRR